MIDEHIDKLRNEILHDNRILYCMHKRPMTETCMCWGLDVPDTWLNEVNSLSKKLEGMNVMAYPVHHVRIQADQVKDKWGLLHFYYDVVVDPPAWILMYENAVEWLMDKISKIDFKCKRVVDKEPYDEVVDVDVPADKVDAEKESCKHISNVEVIECDDGTFVRRTTYHHYERSHLEPTKHKWLYALWRRRYIVKSFMRDLFKWKPTHSQKCVGELLDAYAFRNVIDAEEKCMHICETCGRHIGEDYSPACQTLGWVSYVCEECACKNGSAYIKNGERWQNGKKIDSNDDSEENEGISNEDKD